MWQRLCSVHDWKICWKNIFLSCPALPRGRSGIGCSPHAQTPHEEAHPATFLQEKHPPKVRLGPAPWDSEPWTDPGHLEGPMVYKARVKTGCFSGSPLNLELNQPWVSNDSLRPWSQGREARGHFRNADPCSPDSPPLFKAPPESLLF